MASSPSGIIIRPFAGYRPPAELLGRVASPPYDVIDTQGARAAAAGNEMSFLHVNKPEIDLPEDMNPYDDAVYQRGRENLLAFIEKGFLVRDDAPFLYIYSQQVGDHVQYGIVGELSAQQYEENLIKKHELTRKKKEDDRTRLTDVQSANVGPIFLCYRERESLTAIVNSITANAPEGECTGDDGVTHRIWVIRDPNVIQNIQEEFSQVPCLYVADGHHRTASAARVAKLRAEAATANGGSVTGEEDFNFFLSVIFPHDQLRILDYNRVVYDLGGASPADFVGVLGERGWNVTPVGSSEEAKPTQATECAMFVGGSWYKLQPGQAILDACAGDVVRSLDVSVLTEFLLAPVLGIVDLRKDERIGFVGGIHGLDALAAKVAQKGDGVAFGMYPTSVAQLMSIADAGEIMPPKSTWFEPKLRSGVVVRVF